MIGWADAVTDDLLATRNSTGCAGSTAALRILGSLRKGTVVLYAAGYELIQ